MNKQITINCSRIGKNGTGMWVYSNSVINSLKGHYKLKVVSSKDAVYDIDEADIYRVPACISSTRKISKLRPILWVLYSIFFFPRHKSNYLSTTHHSIPFLRKQIITIYDLRPYYFPDSILQKIYFHYILPRVVGKLEGILTVSNSTKEQIIKEYHVNPNKIHVVPICIDISKFHPKTDDLKKDEPYLLVVGANWRHKNAHEILDNFSLWVNKYRLKIISGAGGYNIFLRKLVKKYEIENQVDFIDYVNQELLLELYQNAQALLYPSILEGFGIPPLEALASGIPVIVSDIPVFREIYGEVPIYINLGEVQTWENAFKLLEDQKFIEDKKNAGLNLVQNYNKQKMAQALLKSIQSIWFNQGENK